MNTAFPTIARTGSHRTNPHNEASSLTPNSLHTYAIVVACLTFILVLAGGLVTSTGSALAVPDWPLSLGQFFPKMDGGVLYEHSHRMIAGTVALLTFVLTGWLIRVQAQRVLRILGVVAAVAVILQAVLGGLTVLYRLPVPVSVAHACLGQIFFSLMVSIAVLTGTATQPVWPKGKLSKFQRLSLMTVGFILLQLVAGATLRHTGNRAALHLHLAGAFLVVVHVQLLARRVLKFFADQKALAGLAVALSMMVIVQLFLGYISWKTGPVITTTLHVGLGALILAGCVMLMWEAFRQPEVAA